MILGSAGALLRVSRAGFSSRRSPSSLLSSRLIFSPRTMSSSPPNNIKEDKNEEPPSILPGIALSAATATAGFQVASILSSSLAIPVSGIPVSILLGMAVNNSVGYSNSFKKGITYSTKTILQGGIVAVAAKLSFVELLTSGVQGMPVVFASVGVGLIFIPIAGRLAGLPQEMSLLLTAGTR
jgi:uncharacterized membrane protein YadS